MPGLYTGASGLWGGFAGLLYGSSALSTPPGLLADAGGFTPASLFAQGEQGVWYDPSDLTTLFQDAAGTIPVTAVEQPVGRILDKSGRGNHATQSTPTSCPVLSARVNLLTYTEQFNNAAWDYPNITPTAAGFSWPYGSSATLWTSTGNFTAVRQAITVTSGVSVKAIFVLKKGSFDWVRLGIFDSAIWGGTHNVQVWFNLGTGAKGTSVTNGSGTLTNYDISPLGDGWHLCSITASLPATTYSFGLAGVTADGGSTRVTNGTLYGGGADLRPANSGVGLPAYQRVGAATDYDTTGFPLFLRFDGTDDSMATGTINPGAVDKAQVFAGVRKLSDAATGVISELSADRNANNGAWSLAGPGTNSSATYSFSSKGTSSVSAISTSVYAAPLSNVITGLGDISGDRATLRIDGTQAAQSTADQGTGNYLSYPLYIGRRGGTTLPFNGHLYSLIVRFSATNLPDATIAQTETWVNGKTYAY